jgi:4-alpha-glucanotransferase
MAQLLTGDVRTLRDYYENQLLELSEQLASLNRINQDLKKSLEREIDDRGEQRKALELELSGHKIQVAELRMKLANANLEMKESVANIGSKMELTS